ncbi:hypothetical protein HMPREF1992_01475 [Selenomonas sp. oral taxon 892 str. F0426]|nr:hypothetical protein HMPREF1992_01475 [Selenomonas sp. oral taxon 892 str. F0426]
MEDLSTQCGQKRCAKMAVLNLSVLPLYGRRPIRRTSAYTMETPASPKAPLPLLSWSPSPAAAGEAFCLRRYSFFT